MSNCIRIGKDKHKRPCKQSSKKREKNKEEGAAVSTSLLLAEDF